MPTSRIEVAWALPVEIDQLGPHLEAYCSLQPVFNELRLCNRFGIGSKAAITRLPVELVQHIERYMLQNKQEQLVPAWVQDFRCWQNLCEPIEHMEDSDILELHNGSIEFDSEFEDCGCCHVPGKAVIVTDHVRECVAEELLEAEDYVWREEHDDRVDAWHLRVGSPTKASRGRFDEFSNVLMKHFGLRVWISHMQESRTLNWVDESTAYTTKAYLCLPQATSVQHDFRHHFVDREFDGPRRPTEAGLATELSMPRALSIKEARRFHRALKALSIVYLPTQKAPSSTTNNASVIDGMGSKDAAMQMDSVMQPKLTLLARNDDEDEW